MPVFDNLTPYFVAMLAPDRPSLEHQWALCVWDDLIDYAPGELFFHGLSGAPFHVENAGLEFGDASGVVVDF